MRHSARFRALRGRRGVAYGGWSGDEDLGRNGRGMFWHVDGGDGDACPFYLVNLRVLSARKN